MATQHTENQVPCLVPIYHDVCEGLAGFRSPSAIREKRQISLTWHFTGRLICEENGKFLTMRS